jgi:hypothetical protein
VDIEDRSTHKRTHEMHASKQESLNLSS